MNILDSILAAQDGSAVKQMGQQLGLGDAQTMNVLSTLVPALAGGFQRNMQSPGGLDALMGALTNGQHAQYWRIPPALPALPATGTASSDTSSAAKTSAATSLSEPLRRRVWTLASSSRPCHW